MKKDTSFLTTELTNIRTVCVVAAVLFLAGAGRAACVYDTTFATDGIGANDTVYGVGVLPNGKIVLGGSFTHINGAPRPRFAILNSNGTLDPYFYNNPNNTIRAVVIQPDTKVLIGGDFTTVYGGSKPYLARVISTHGTTDSLTVSNLNSSVYAIALQPDGKILIGGSFSLPKPGIARLNSDGTVDTTFNPGTGTDNGIVYAIAVNTILGSPNYGKVYIGGNFYKYNSVDRARIARLNSNGTLDTTFSAPTPNHNVYSVAVQYVDGEEKILMGGAFTGDSFITSHRFARMYASGAVDHAFDFTFNQVDGDVRAITIQSDGNILIGGAFTQVGTYSRRGVARLYANGGVDPNWDPCGGAINPGHIWAVAIQPNGYMFTGGIIVGGYFSYFDYYQHWNYARLAF